MEPNESKIFFENAQVAWEEVAPGLRRQIMAYDERLMLVRVEFAQGAVGTLHQHHHTQITQVESGVFEIEIGSDKKVLRGGDAFYVPPHAQHGALCLEAGILIDVFSPSREDFLTGV